MNGEHNLVGIEYIEDNIGYNLTTFKNSYYKQTVMYTQSIYIENYNQDYKFFFSAGAATGYKDTGGICILEIDNLCGVLGAGVIITTYDLRPRFLVFGETLVFSLEYKW